ncbi:hypothetical protein KC717_04230 [Candidatus Dojkabacteria bacterium]|uniref:Uncharacterized protein n=1 Tax=Candidatus Dojkabacteria bacterium TaxID=2099670 RepID=A0A955L8U5_9BACT|nr:hypothetical protein [Candidatus Dojkabacteria bacterium]
MSAKLEEYFELQDTIRTIKADMKEMIDNHDLTEEINEIKKELKNRKDQIAEDEGIVVIKDKIKTLKERQDLLKEIILVEMKEAGQEKLEYNGNEIVIAEALKIKKKKK